MKLSLRNSIQSKIFANTGAAVSAAILLLIISVIAIRAVNVCLVMTKAERYHTVSLLHATTNFEKYVRTGDEKYYIKFSQHLEISFNMTRLFSTLNQNMKNRPVREVAEEIEKIFPSTDYGQCRDLVILAKFFSSNRIFHSLIENTRVGNNMTRDLRELAQKYRNSTDENDIQNILNSIYDYYTIMTDEATDYSQNVDKLSKWVISLVTKMMIILVISVTALVFIVIIRMMKPVRHLTRASTAIADGDLNYEITITSKDEIGIFAQSFMRMRDVIREKITELQNEIRERHQAEKEVRKLNIFQQGIIDNANVWINMLDKDSNVTIWNKAAEEISGFSAAEVIGHSKVWEWSYPDEKYRAEIVRKAAAIINENEILEDFETEIHTKSGEKKIISWYSRNLVDEKGELMGSVALGRDVTLHRKTEKDKKELEEQLYQSQKMESIGRLAGGIAHDFNNILTGILGYAELLNVKYCDPSSEESVAADVIMKGAERASDLTKQLLGFARGGKYNPVPIDLNKLITETVKVTEKVFDKNISVKYDFEENIKSVEADKNQLDQVFTNLIINAKDAMPSGGKLQFITRNIYLDEEFIRKSPDFLKGSYVQVSISDTGVGIDRKTKEKIFEPFFSTKGDGKGTGLGLSMVYGIIKNHDGHISVNSKPGKGTEFIIYFPVSAKKIIETDRKPQIFKGDACILVVDDEEHVRNIAKNMLEELGYSVLLAVNGKDGLEIFKKSKNEIDLVVLDMIMPEMAGKETNLKLRNIQPDVKVLLASGYSQEGKASSILEEGAVGFIQKPFRLDQLSEAVKNALGK